MKWVVIDGQRVRGHTLLDGCRSAVESAGRGSCDGFGDGR